MSRALPARFFMLLLAAGRLSAAESNFGAAATLNPLQSLGNGARPISMGSAFTAVGGDLASLYFNPAGLARLKGSQASANHNSWLGGIQQETLLFALGAPAFSFGLSGDLVNYGAIDGFDDSGNPTEAFTPMDFSIGATLAKELANRLCLGGAIRATQQSIKDAGQLAMSADVGAQYFSGNGFGFGISYANLGPPVNGRALTGALRLGVSYEAALAPGYGLLVSSALAGMSNGQQQFQLGAEARLGGVLFPRVGYQVNFLDQQYGGLAGLSAGLGLGLGPLSIDYAYLPYGTAGMVHRVSLVYNFISALKTAAPVSGQASSMPSGSPAGAAAKAHATPAPKGAGLELVFEAEDAATGSTESLLLEVQKQPLNAQAWRNLGAHYYRQKRLPEAIAAYEKALSLNPSDKALENWLTKAREAGNKSASPGH